MVVRGDEKMADMAYTADKIIQTPKILTKVIRKGEEKKYFKMTIDGMCSAVQILSNCH